MTNNTTHPGDEMTEHHVRRISTRFEHVASIMTDRRYDRSTRLRMLQGWRSTGLDMATRVNPIAHRLTPAACAALAIGVMITGSWVLLAATMATAVFGVVGPNHPFELAYNAVAASRGRPRVPTNRAAKRFGCAVGTIFLGASGVVLFAGHPDVANLMMGSLAALATFVAATDICVPSIIYTLVWGADRGTHDQLISFRGHRR